VQASELINEYFRLKEPQRKALAKLGLKTLADLLNYFPTRYESGGQDIVGQVISQKTSRSWRTKMPMATMQIERSDGSKVKAVWFHQAYMAKKVLEGTLVRLSGSMAKNGTLTNPRLEIAGDSDQDSGLFSPSPDSPNLVPLPDRQAGSTYQLVPVYPESRGISSLWLTYAIAKLLKANLHKQIQDPIPSDILTRYHLPSLEHALIYIHTPKKASDAEVARKRFSFQEIFIIQLIRQKARLEYDSSGAYEIWSEVGDFVESMPFTPTKSQNLVLKNILSDMQRSVPMTRLLEGDVGSGKTFVAAAATYATIKAGFQVAYMAPTEILAKQHFESFISFFKNMGNIQIGLLTGSECRKYPSKIEASGHTHVSRTQLQKWVADGSMNIVIGTHAHASQSVKWKRLALAIIDEQHRFGIDQRGKLAKKGAHAPHLLSMTATPIPRTLALTIYADLDLSLLDESPPGRKPIMTEVVPPKERARVYEHIRKQVKLGRQAYVICPRIYEPDPTKEMALETKDVESETNKLGTTIFPEFTVAGLHGKMKAHEKDEIMREFVNNEIQILVATSVIEVGVNVPNSTIIIIEGAERFGLAQLHQLRGRVLRSSHQAHCYLFVTNESAGANIPARLKSIEKAKNGFELAEEDLKLRGPGSLIGKSQWGISDVGMEALKNLKLVEAARTEAKRLITSDPSLANHPLLAARLQTDSLLHFE